MEGAHRTIHYAEPFPEMVDTSHLGGPAGDRHLRFLAVEVLATSEGTGLVYLLDTTNYTMSNGNLRFEPAFVLDLGNPNCLGALLWFIL